MKKLIVWGSVALVIVICFCMPYWVDDFACEQYRIEIEKVIVRHYNKINSESESMHMEEKEWQQE